MPLWVWNGQMSRERIDAMLGQFAVQGIGGVFIHPRPGLITEYLSDEWFDLWGHALERCKSLGLQCHIYDENSYPAGFAGGHTVSANPHLAGTHLERVHHDRPLPKQRGATPILAAVRLDAGNRVLERLPLDRVNPVQPGSELVTLELRPLPARLWTAGFPHVDLLRPETTRTFLELTHAAYHARFGAAFGKTIRWAFADEPKVCYGAFPMSEFLLREFRFDHGYDLQPELHRLFYPVAGEPNDDAGRAVRFDFWSTVNRLFLRNYLKASHDWCETHGIGFTGHFHECAWPAPTNQPSTMAGLRWMQAPGNDLLGFQFKPTTLAENGVYFLNLCELHSIKRQCSRSTSLVESTGGGGYGFTLRDFKVIEDVLLAFGVNLINPHLSHETLSGAREWDWPHTLSDHSPWWHDYRHYTDHIARTNALLSQGLENKRVLVLHPDTTGWLVWLPDEEENHNRAEGLCAELQQRQIRLLLSLYQAGLEFDLGDEFTLAELGRIEGGRLAVGPCAYEVIVIPDFTLNLLPSTLQQLREFAEAGGTLIAPGRLPAYLNGRPSPEIEAALRERVTAYQSPDEIPSLVRGKVSPRLKVLDGTAENLCWRRVEIGDGVAWFFANPFDTPLEATIELSDPGPWVELDTHRGEVRAERTDGPISLELKPRRHCLLVTRSLLPELAPAPPAREGEPLGLELASVERTEPNLLVLDYCDLEVDGQRYAGIDTMRADEHNWRGQGFRGNVWSRGIQFRKTFLETPPRDGSGFEVTYRFEIDPGDFDAVRGTLEFALERPELYTICVNGRPLSGDSGRRWFDEAIRAFPIGALARPGANAVRLVCRPFHMLAEIKPAFVLGDFRLRGCGKGFIVAADEPLQRTGWIRQGLPFYPAGVVHRFRFELTAPCSGLAIDAGNWQGSALEASLDGAGEPDSVAYLTGEPLQIRRPLEPGAHELALTLRGNLENQLGPHFCDGLPGPWSWSQCPETLPPGERYRFYATGLFDEPVLCPLE